MGRNENTIHTPHPLKDGWPPCGDDYIASIAEAIGKCTEAMLAYRGRLEDAALWYQLDMRSPTRMRPSAARDKLQRTAAAARKLLRHLGIHDTCDAPDGPGEGLKTRLMEPDLVEEFIRAFQIEVNKQRAQEEVTRHQVERELKKITMKLEGLYEAIADGLRTDGLKATLEELEKRQSELQIQLAQSPPPKPRLHPKLARLYRDKVESLHAALSDPQDRTEAAEILRSLIQQINVSHEKDGVRLELIGDIVELISLPEGSRVPASFESSVKVVAGAGFEPATFRL